MELNRFKTPLYKTAFICALICSDMHGMDDSIKIPKKFNRNSDIASSSNSSTNKNYRTDDMSESELDYKNTFDIVLDFMINV